ncbi:MAG: hypothetical protein HN341_11415 [Verrucomicrobia bacterium]|jgi:hypothetical protein|nr:hypothetical protein [Verrucomicrobiota bacterium]
MDSNAQNIEEERVQINAGRDLSCVTRSLIVFVLFSVLLNASGLQRSASLLPFGPRRRICMALTRPVAAASAHLHADRLRLWFERFSASEGQYHD